MGITAWCSPCSLYMKARLGWGTPIPHSERSLLIIHISLRCTAESEFGISGSSEGLVFLHGIENPFHVSSDSMPCYKESLKSANSTHLDKIDKPMKEKNIRKAFADFGERNYRFQ